MSASSHLLAPEVVEGVALVGKIVTLNERQYKVHSVEGRTWYAFDKDGSTSLDLGFPPASWMLAPVATVIPMGHYLGEGYSFEVGVDRLTRGVCLVKSWV
jgi:hypothetical protein